MTADDPRRAKAAEKERDELRVKLDDQAKALDSRHFREGLRADDALLIEDLEHELAELRAKLEWLDR